MFYDDYDGYNDEDGCAYEDAWNDDFNCLQVDVDNWLDDIDADDCYLSLYKYGSYA